MKFKFVVEFHPDRRHLRFFAIVIPDNGSRSDVARKPSLLRILRHLRIPIIADHSMLFVVLVIESSQALTAKGKAKFQWQKQVKLQVKARNT